MAERFVEFCRIDLQLTDLTIRDHRQNITRFLRFLGKSLDVISVEDIRKYLTVFKENPNVYRNNLASLKVFFRDFLKMPYLVESFKFPSKVITVKNGLPNKEQLRQFYEAIPNLREKAAFLLFANSGLRISEALSLRFQDVDLSKRMVTPKNHEGRTKKSWVSFYNTECETVLNEYLKSIHSNSDLMFPIKRKRIETLFKEVSDKIGVKVTPQTLREWFCSELGRLGVQDRYVDAFCGRIPKSVLARHYTDFSPERLKEIYDKANLAVLNP